MDAQGLQDAGREAGERQKAYTKIYRALKATRWGSHIPADERRAMAREAMAND